MVNKRTIAALCATMLAAFGCYTLPDRATLESELLAALADVAPLAKEIYDLQIAAEQNVRVGMSGDPSGYRPMYGAEAYRRLASIQARMEPYKYKLDFARSRFMAYRGQIEYNNLIIQNGYEWGLGVHW